MGKETPPAVLQCLPSYSLYTTGVGLAQALQTDGVWELVLKIFDLFLRDLGLNDFLSALLCQCKPVNGKLLRISIFNFEGRISGITFRIPLLQKYNSRLLLFFYTINLNP